MSPRIETLCHVSDVTPVVDRPRELRCNYPLPRGHMSIEGNVESLHVWFLVDVIFPTIWGVPNLLVNEPSWDSACNQIYEDLRSIFRAHVRMSHVLVNNNDVQHTGRVFVVKDVFNNSISILLTNPMT